MKRKISIGLVLCLSFGIIAAGCGNSNVATDTSTSTTESTASASSAAPAEKVTLSVFGMFNTPDADANLKSFDVMKKKFVADFPNVTFKEEQIPHDEFETKMKTYAAANELPNVFELKGTMIPGLVDNSQIVEIDPIIAMAPGLKEGYKAGVFDDFLYKAKAYAAPFQMGNNHNVFWNEEIFKECGIDAFPTTWKDFLGAIEKIKAKGYVPIAMGNKGKWVAESLIYNTIVYRYAPVDWYLNLRDGKGAKWTDTEIVEATNEFAKMAKNGTFNTDMNSIDNIQQCTLYYNKKAAMFIEGFWAVDPVCAEAPADVLKATHIAQFPAVEGAKGAGNVNQAAAGWGWAVSSNLSDGQKTAVANFIKYATGVDYANLVVANRGLPASKPTKVDKASMPALYSELLKLNDESVFAPVFDVQLAPNVVDALYSNMQELLIGSMSGEKYCELAQIEMDKNKK
ncbi:MAG TPA: extracellular solute-binding protein [Ruminiclostridium sp.]